MAKDVIIRSTGRYLPERVVVNEEFEAFLDTSDEWITERTGIKERRFAAPGETTSDMALAARKQCLQRAGMDPADVELTIIPTVTGDTPFPATANWLQGKLGNKRAWSFDLNAGCSGFVYALCVTTALLRSGVAKNALLVGAEKMTAISNFTDRSHCVLFGDAAACLLLEAVDSEDNQEGYGVKEFYLKCDGSLAPILIQHAGGTNIPASYTSVAAQEHFLSMDGPLVYKHAVRHMLEAITEVLAKVEVEPKDVDWFVPHQANARILVATQERLGVEPEKGYINVQRYGNTTSASIPLCLDELAVDGKLAPGKKVVLFTFGTGLTWGSCYLVWGGSEG